MSANYAKQFLIALLFGLLCFAPLTARAEEEGIVQSGLSAQTLQTDYFEDNNDSHQSYNELGYRPVRLTGYVDGGQVRYFTRWIHNTDGRAWKGYFGKTVTEFDALVNTLKSQGYVMTDVSGYDTPNGVRYAMLWEKKAGLPLFLPFRNTTYAGMQILHDGIGQQGWVPHRVEGYEVNGQSYYTSIWYYQPGAGYIIHSRMTYQQYQDHFSNYNGQGYRLTHLDAHTVGSTVYYSGIWKPSASSPAVRSNRDGREFQRYYNNYWAAGYNIDNFYVAETPSGLRFGGIWYFDGVPNNATLYREVRKIVDGAPALGGAAILNLTTGEDISIHGNQSFAIASTIKIGVLYAVLREVDKGNVAWLEYVNSNTSSGSNQCTYLQPNTNYTVVQLARFMIRCSNNWATNLLIQRVGRTTINQDLDELGLDVTRVNRYLSGGPSVHGNASANADRAEGWENLSTPREMVKLLRRVLQDNVLSNTGETRFWDVLGDDGDGIGVNDRNYIAAQVSPMFSPRITVYNKAGNLGDPGIASRHVNADAGRFTFPDGQEVLVAFFMDFVSNDPDAKEEASATAINNAVKAIKDAAEAVANRYH